jgi:hypothetical protein
VLARVELQHPVEEGEFQASPFAHIHGKAASGEPSRPLQIQKAQALGQSHVVLRREIELRRFPPGAEDNLFLLRAHGNGIVGDVGQGKELRFEFGLHPGKALLHFFAPFRQSLQFPKKLLLFFVSVLAGKLSDALGALVLLPPDLVDLLLESSAFFIQGKKPGKADLRIAPAKPSENLLRVAPNPSQIEHGLKV